MSGPIPREDRRKIRCPKLLAAVTIKAVQQYGALLTTARYEDGDALYSEGLYANGTIVVWRKITPHEPLPQAFPCDWLPYWIVKEVWR